MEERKESDYFADSRINLNNLIPELKCRNQAAFKFLFFKMQPSIFYFLYRLTSSKSVAEDLTQETFLRFWYAVDRLDETKSCQAYVYKIARNLAINHSERNINLASIDETETLLRLSKSLDGEMDNMFLMDDFQRAVNTLPERCKATFLLSRFSGFDYSEIAEIMNVSVQTVKNQMNKALAVLRKRLIKYLE